jgi:hypothetical protein
LISSCGASPRPADDEIVISSTLIAVNIGRDSGAAVNRFTYRLTITEQERLFFQIGYESQITSDHGLSVSPRTFAVDTVPDVVTVEKPFADETPQQYLQFNFQHRLRFGDR